MRTRTRYIIATRASAILLATTANTLTPCNGPHDVWDARVVDDIGAAFMEKN